MKIAGNEAIKIRLKFQRKELIALIDKSPEKEELILAAMRIVDEILSQLKKDNPVGFLEKSLNLSVLLDELAPASKKDIKADTKMTQLGFKLE